jgi:hypothetical protein
VPRNGTTIAIEVSFTSCGPNTADNRPPAITRLIALGRKASLAVSAAAKR